MENDTDALGVGGRFTEKELLNVSLGIQVLGPANMATGKLIVKAAINDVHLVEEMRVFS